MASTYLTRTFGSATNRSKCTISFWVKKGFSGDTQQPFCSYADNNNRFQLYFESTDELSIYNKDNGSDTIYLKSMAKYRDPNAWYHIYASVDTTISTASDRVKLYVNGERITSFHPSQNIPNQNSDLSFGNNAFTFNLGRYGGTGHHLNGILSHFYFIDGSVVAHTQFGSTDSTTGEWKINTAPTISDFGNEGCKLFIDNNSLTDQSGKGNNMTLAAGTLTKTEDNPSNVFATGNALIGNHSNGNALVPTYTNGNTTSYYGSGEWRIHQSTLGASSGKFYCEYKWVSNSNTAYAYVGIYDLDGYAQKVTGYPYMADMANCFSIKDGNGQVWTGSSGTSYGTSYTVGDIIGVAMDLDNNKCYWSKNGTWMNSANPSSGTGGYSITADKTYAFGIQQYSQGGSTWSANYGNGYFGTTAVSSAGTNASNLGIFEYDVPSGYTALCTKGLNE